MTGAPQITDRDSLEAWLDALPRDTEAEVAEADRVATAIAFRAAMRVLPRAIPFFLSETARKRDLTPQPLCRSLLIAGVAAKCPTPVISAAAAARAAAYAAADAHAHAWTGVATDCEAISDGMPLHLRPLWPDGTNPLSKDWQSAAQALTEAGPEWAFWIDWYEKCLDGTPQDWEGLLTDIALIDPADWDKGPKHIAGLIEELQKRRRAPKARPEARTVEIVRRAVSANRQPLRLQLEALILVLSKELEKNTLETEVRDRLAELHRIASELHGLLPSTEAVEEEAAVEMVGLLDLYKEKLKAWPRLHADDVVDGTFRITLIGLSAGAFGLFGVPAWAGVALGGAVFGGKRLVDAAKSLRGSMSGGGS